MMKFFRKHNKKLLAIFMVLLMVVFLGGSALNSLLRPTINRVVAQSRLGSISYQDIQAAENRTQILTSLSYNWQRPVPGVAEPLELIDWVLLSRETKRLGLGRNLTKLRISLPDASRVEDFSRQLRVKPSVILTAMADMASIQQTTFAVGGITIPSEAGIEAAARRAMEKVHIQAVLLPAEVFVDEKRPFTEKQIDVQFTAYRDHEAGKGLAFGYYVPPKIRVQYFRLDRDAIAAHVRVPNLEQKAKHFFDEEREKNPAFRKPPEESTTKDQAGDAEVADPPPPPESPYLTWDQAKDKAVGLVRKREADKAVSRIADWLVQFAAEAWLDVERGKDGYKTAPPDVADEKYYDSLIENIPATIAYPEAVSTGMTAFFSEAEADKVPLLGQATFVAPQAMRWDNLRSLAFRTQAIIPKVPSTKDTNPADYLATFQTCRYPLRDSDGNVFIFRVFDVQAGHVPTSVDEVRDQVLADLRLRRGYEEAKARAESLRSCGPDITLQEAYESHDDLVALIDAKGMIGSGFVEPPPFPRTTRYAATKGDTPSTTFIPGGIGQVPADVVEQFFHLAQSDPPIMTVELPGRATVMVVQWLDTQQTQSDDYRDQRKALMDEMVRYRAQDAIVDWLKPENIRARNGFELVTNN